MKIIPLAFDSLGTRSMATYIETSDLKVVIDPAVSLAAIKSGLPPHPIELQREAQHWEIIKRSAKQADVLIVTHYHYDHHNPSEPEVYQDKKVFIKHPQENINESQRERAAYFLNVLENIPSQIEYSDGREFRFGKTIIKFSPAVPHGNNARLGYVTEVSITDGEYKLVHTSDIEGGNLDCQRDFILNEDPDILIFDGPMTYPFQNIIPNMLRIIKETRVKDFLIEHHYLRKSKWQDKIKEASNTASELNKRVICVAEFLGQQPDQLEAKRKKLWLSSEKGLRG
ncbi:MAG: hypothetical protein QME42_09745 [bacterium]|nr:hypothetical protein [bacterium]